MKDVKLGCKIIAVLIFLTLLVNFSIVVVPIKLIYYMRASDGFGIVYVIMGLIFLLSNLFAAISLFRTRRFGFGAAYAAIVFSTFVFGVSYLPFFDKLFPAKYAPFAALVANIGILTLLISLQMMTFEPRKKLKPKRKK